MEEIRKAISTNPVPAEKSARHGTLIEPIAKLKAMPLPPAPLPVVPLPASSDPASTIAPASLPVARAAPSPARPAAGRPPGAVSAGRPGPLVPSPQNPSVPSGRGKSSVDTTLEPAEGGSSDVVPFRPVNRPPMAVLKALDDGARDEGETLRIRQSVFVIGRTQGDFQIPHDSEISSKHVQLSRREEDGRFLWFLTDLGSTNGTFLKAAKVPLRERIQLLIGSCRYEYRSGVALDQAERASEVFGDAEEPEATVLERAIPSLVELTPEGDGRRYPLPMSDATLGSAAACGLQILGDSCVSEIHARLGTEESGRRYLENVNSLNGLWVRIQEQRVDQDFEFQIGEQRFLVRFP